jgi:hypothetical protein
MIPGISFVANPAKIVVKTSRRQFFDQYLQLVDHLCIVFLVFVIEHRSSQVHYLARPADANLVLPDQMLGSFLFFAGL